MREVFLGDSFDLVKRFWGQTLGSIAPLLAHSRFVPEPLRPRYTLLTSIPVFDFASAPAGPLGLLLDPHTGIPLPGHKLIEATPAHAPLPYILRELRRLRPSYMVCFDQSHHRKHSLEAEWTAKREYLQSQGVPSFYYISHAPFLFLANTVQELEATRKCLKDAGIPDWTPGRPGLQDILLPI